ncbi:MAG: bifunctional histidinol-phosphatase/imidazoleglycerol-phosphate dehydratase HisB [Rikenellaceae bacterium]
MQEAKKVLFIDRDGTIIVEPPIDYQIDSLEKLEFLPGVISALSSVRGLDYDFVMASNQDGLGTDSFPEDTFWPAHNKMLKTLEGEGVTFDDFLIDRTFEHENANTRKPQTGMFTKYLEGDYDLANSYVIGDRITDVMLAKNLGCKAILLQMLQNGQQMLNDANLEQTCALVTDSWAEIAEFLRSESRVAKISRQTKETKILVELDLDGEKMGNVKSNISTGLNFLDHMIDQIVHHAGVALRVEVEGDLHVDEHHTMEDTAIVLGEAFLQALGNKRGIERYGYALPMDECEAKVLLDFSGRIEFVWNVEFSREMIGDVPTEMFKHFFKSFAQAAKCNLHIEAKGENEHHKIEGVFKALARAIKMAINRNAFSDALPSSKGML